MRWFFATTLLLMPLLVNAKPLSLSDCLSLRSKIDKFTELRRGGGAAADMESWKRARRRVEQSFREGRCRVYGRKVR